MQEKINKINSLDSEIGNIESALYVYGAHGKLYQGDKNKQNRISSILVTNHIWTGSQNPRYERALTSEDAIDKITEVTITILSQLVKEKKEELEKLII